MKAVTILIKPASGKCNMRCRYCFYQDEAENREYKDYGMMSEDTARNLIDKSFSAFDDVTFAFQGGEPTVRGLDFFRFFTEYAESKEKRVHFAIQTNGFCLDRQWCSFFHDHRYLVGLSMDGDKALHDRYRVDGGDKGTFRRVFSSFQLLTSASVDFNVLITLTKDAALRGKEIYQFLKRNGARYQQYIPCLDPMAKERGSEDFMCRCAILTTLSRWLWGSDRSHADFLVSVHQTMSQRLTEVSSPVISMSLMTISLET